MNHITIKDRVVITVLDKMYKIVYHRGLKDIEVLNFFEYIASYVASVETLIPFESYVYSAFRTFSLIQIIVHPGESL